MRRPALATALAVCSAASLAACPQVESDFTVRQAVPDAARDVAVVDSPPDVSLADAATDATEEGLTPGDGSNQDATGVDVSTLDVVTDANPADAFDGFVCTPFSGTGSSSACAGTYAVPVYYAISNGSTTDPACWPQNPTPTACTCRETYNCACIKQIIGCKADPNDGGTWVSCDDTSGNEVLVTCE